MIQIIDIDNLRVVATFSEADFMVHLQRDAQQNDEVVSYDDLLDHHTEAVAKLLNEGEL